MQSQEMFDDNTDGKIDRVLVKFSESLAPFTAPATVFSLSSAPSAATLNTVTVSGDQATLALNQGANAATTAVGSFKISLTSNALGIRDAAGNLSSYASTAPTDRAAPALVTLSLLDNNGNGKVDRVTALFSETLQTYSAATTPWTLANVPSGGTLASVALSSATLTLTLTEGAGAADTTVGTMTVAMAANAAGARDAIGNLGTFAATTPLDKAKPAAATITDTNGSLDGKAEPGDTIVITFSEPLAPASVPSSTTVTITDPAGTGNDTLTMVGVSNGARTMGANNYVTLDGGVASFANSHRRPEQRQPHDHGHDRGTVQWHRLHDAGATGDGRDLLVHRRNHPDRRRRQPRRNPGQDPEHPPVLTARQRAVRGRSRPGIGSVESMVQLAEAN